MRESSRAEATSVLLLLPMGWRGVPEGSGTCSSRGCRATPAPIGSTRFTDPHQRGKAVVLRALTPPLLAQG